MTWNYRVCRSTSAGPPLYGIRVVHYDDVGNIFAVADEDLTGWETPDDLRSTLEMMLAAFQLPVVDEDQLVLPSGYTPPPEQA